MLADITRALSAPASLATQEGNCGHACHVHPDLAPTAWETHPLTAPELTTC